MSHSTHSQHPVTVTHLPLVRCAVCRRTIAHRSGQASVVLTEHYEKAHPEVIGGDEQPPDARVATGRVRGR